MQWDLAHHRGVGFTLYILRPVGVYSILANLRQEPGLSPADLMSRLAESNAADAPLVGLRDLSDGIGGLLGSLRKQGLIARSGYAGPGSHTRYEVTELGAGLVDSLGPLTRWAMGDFEFVVTSIRIRLGLPPLDGPVPAELCRERPATGMAIGLLSHRWSNPIMVYVDSSGPEGIGPQDLEGAINADIAATSGEHRVVRTLRRQALHATLNRLVAKGLLEKHPDPPRMRYVLTGHGRGLMSAWWQVAEDYGIPHDAELFRIVQATSGWFSPQSGS